MTLKPATVSARPRRLLSPWLACWPIARTGLRLVLRRWPFWLVLGLAAISFLLNFAFIYLKAWLTADMGEFAANLLEWDFESGEFYRDFMFGQGAITTILLAFAGSTIVGNDYRFGGVTFYFSRRIGRIHYVLGKMLAIGLLVTLTTTLPALVLFIEQGVMSDSLWFFWDHLWIVGGILGYGLIISLVLSLLVLAFGCWLKRTVPLVITWVALMLFLPSVSQTLYEVFDDESWLLLNLWWDLGVLGSWSLGVLEGDEERLFWWAAAVLAGVCGLAAAALVPRMREVRVVE